MERVIVIFCDIMFPPPMYIKLWMLLIISMMEMLVTMFNYMFMEIFVIIE